MRVRGSDENRHAAQHGAVLFHDKRCESCHTMGPYGGLRGPNFTHVADRISTQQMEWRILNGGHNMPAFAGILNPGEVDDILSFCTRATSWATPASARLSHSFPGERPHALTKN